MAQNLNEQATSTVNVNGEQAKQELSALAKRAETLKQKLKEANDAGDGKAFDKLSKQLKATQKEMKQLEKDSFDLKKVLNNLSGSSMADLTKAKRELDKQLNSPALQRNSKEWKQIRNDLKAVKSEISSITNEAKVGESGMSKWANGFNKYFAIFTAFAAGITGITLGLKKFMDLRNELEDASANLKSLTGLGDKDIEWLRQYAKELSTTTTEAGVRITASSKEIMDGFTTIGSKRPELLKNKEAMAAVTKEALTLAAAGKMDVATAFDVVTASMNQFNLGAAESGRIINVIAAGSLEGSAEADSLAGSLKNVGTVADGSNMTLEDTVAMLEVLASKQLLGEEAGTKLRGAILKMKDAGVGYVSGAFNVRDAIIEVNKQLDKKTSALQKDALVQKIFGAENITAGQILLTNVEAYDKLKLAVTGTNVAYKQAVIQTDTVSVKMAQAKNKLNEAGMELVKNVNPAILKAANLTILFLKGLIALPKWLNENKGLLITLASVTLAYAIAVNRARIASLAQLAIEKSKVIWTNISTAATLAQVAVTGYLTGATRVANLATKAFFTTLGLNPFIAIGVAIAAITIGIYKLVTSYNSASQAQKSMETVQKNASARYEEESEKIRLLNLKIHSNIFSLDERRKALDELKKIIPGYNAMLDSEGKLTNDNTKAIDDYLVALEKQIRMKAAQEEWENLIRKKRKQEQSLAAANVKADNYKELVKTNPNMATSYAAAGGIVASIGKEIEQTTEALKALEAEIKTTTVVAAGKKPNGPKEGDISADGLMIFKGGKWVKINAGGSGLTDEEREKAFKKAEDALEASGKRRQIITDEMYQALNMSEYLHEQMSLINTIETLQAKEKLYKKYGKDTADIEKQISDARLKQFELDKKYRENYEKSLENVKKLDIASPTEDNPVIDTETYTLALRLKILEAFHNKGLRSEEEYQKELANLLKGNQDEINKYLKDVNLQNNEQRYKEGLIGEKEYLDNNRQIYGEYIDNKFAKEQQLAQDISQVASAAADLSASMQDAAMMRVDNKYAKELDAARRAGKDTTAIEEKIEKEKKDIKKKYADVDFAITVAQIIASTASAVMNALKIPPPVGEILAGIVGATGLAQIAVANEQRQAIKNLWTGGYTDPGDKYEPRGIVHAGEFVANQDAVGNRTLRKLFNVVDYAQKTNTVARIDNDAIARALSIGQGYAGGGFVSPAGTSGTSDSSIMNIAAMMAVMQQSNAVNAALLSELQKGIKAKTYLTGDGGINEATDTYNTIISNARR